MGCLEIIHFSKWVTFIVNIAHTMAGWRRMYIFLAGEPLKEPQKTHTIFSFHAFSVPCTCFHFVLHQGFVVIFNLCHRLSTKLSSLMLGPCLAHFYPWSQRKLDAEFVYNNYYLAGDNGSYVCIYFMTSKQMIISYSWNKLGGPMSGLKMFLKELVYRDLKK